MACLPKIIISGFSFSTIALSALATPNGSGLSLVSIKIALSAPKAKQVLNCSWDAESPTDTATTSSASPDSLSLTASSIAISQKGLIAIFALLKSGPLSSALALTLTL